MINHSSIIKILLLILIAAAGSVQEDKPIEAASIDDVSFNNEYSSSGTRLSLRGYSILNYMLVIKAYAGALYLKADTPPDLALSDTPRILELYYFHKISAEDFKASTIEMIRKNTESGEYQRIENQIVIFNRFYKDVKPGDRYRSEYTPSRGTTLYLNGKSLGTIKGNEFSRAFFSIWIGREPIDKNFRDILLGKK